MARIRTVKPEHWSDKQLANISLQAHLLWIATWNFSDDEGVFENDPVLIKSNIFPRRTDVRVEQISQWLDQLVKARFIVPFDYKNESYFIQRTFKAHQRIDKPQASKIPESLIISLFQERSENDPRTFSPVEESIVEESSSKSKVKVKEPKIEFISKVFLTEKEKEKILIEFGEDSDLALTILSNYKNSSGKKYVSDYHVLIGWVKEKVLKEKNSAKKEVYGKQHIGTKTGQQHPLQSLADLSAGVLQGIASQNGEGGATT